MLDPPLTSCRSCPPIDADPRVPGSFSQVLTPVPARGTLMELLLRDDRFGELVTALIVTGLGTLLRGGGGGGGRFLTVLAPTDAAFRNAPPAVVERILQDKHVLESE